MYRFEPEEARAAVELIRERFGRMSGLGDLIFKLERESGESVIGYVVEVDGESSRDGILLGGMPPDQEHHFIRWDEVVWLAFGYTK